MKKVKRMLIATCVFASACGIIAHKAHNLGSTVYCSTVRYGVCIAQIDKTYQLDESGTVYCTTSSTGQCCDRAILIDSQ